MRASAPSPSATASATLNRTVSGVSASRRWPRVRPMNSSSGMTLDFHCGRDGGQGGFSPLFRRLLDLISATLFHSGPLEEQGHEKNEPPVLSAPRRGGHRKASRPVGHTPQPAKPRVG